MNFRKTAEKLSFGFKIGKIYKFYYIDQFSLLTLDSSVGRASDSCPIDCEFESYLGQNSFLCPFMYCYTPLCKLKYLAGELK
jgi:hypothetical protein